MKLYLSHSSNFNYQTELYAPLKANLANSPEVFFPHDKENIDIKSKDIIAASDFVIAEVSYPSTGQGIELGWADANNTPIICFSRTDAKVSDSLRFISATFIEYSTPNEMTAKLQAWLDQQ